MVNDMHFYSGTNPRISMGYNMKIFFITIPYLKQ